MKIVAAMFKHETNTFSPVKTDYDRFEQWGTYFGDQAIDKFENTGMPIGAYIKAAKEIGAKLEVPVIAEAMPSGIVEKDVYDDFSGRILDSIHAGCDLILLDLHGAMVVQSLADAEGHLLSRIRAIAPNTPIGVTCDFHGNITQQMVDNSNVLMGYKTYPHVDMFETGRSVADLAIKTWEKKISSKMIWKNIPVLAQTLRMATDDYPMKGLIESCVKAEQEEKIYAASVFGGFPLSDFEGAGMSAVVICEKGTHDGEVLASRLMNTAWEKRHDFVYQGKELNKTLKEVKRFESFPLLLVDHADNCGSGGTQDVMTVVSAIIEHGIQDVAVACICDPLAVQQACAAGEGANISLEIGGKYDMPSVGLKGEPLKLTGTVSKVTDGKWQVEGDMYKGVTINMGPTILFEFGTLKIIIVSYHHEPWDVGIFAHVGINVSNEKYLMLKSRIHFRDSFKPFISKTIYCDGNGVTTSDNTQLDYKNIRRPIFPLDDI